MACGEHLLDHCQSLKDIKKIAGKEAFQVSTTECFHILKGCLTSRRSLDAFLVSVPLQDGLLVLHFALVLPSET